MKFKSGDRVRFLNTSGGGIITKITGTDMVNVAIEDGFEIPTLISEIIKVEVDNTGEEINKTIFPVSATQVSGQEADAGYERVSELGRLPGRQQRAAGVYLVFHPRDQQWLLTGRMDIFVVNNTSWDILYSLYLKMEDGSLRGIDYDGIPPHSKLMLKTVKREELSLWTEGVLQVLFHKSRPEQLLQPANSRFRITESRFLKESGYIETSFLPGRSLMVCLAEIATPARPSRPEESVQEEIPEKQAAMVAVPDFLEKHQAGTGIAEVDLHIDMITDEAKSMNDGEKLRFQLAYAKQCIDAALDQRYQKLILIHGTGNGTLRRELHILLSDYEGIEVFDASYKRFGTGAIEVRFRRKQAPA